MPNASNYLESGILEHIFRQGTFSKPTAYIALTRAVPSDTNTGATIDEIPQTGVALTTAYVRQIATGAAVWTVPADDGNGSGYITNATVITFPQYLGGSSIWCSGIAVTDNSGHLAGNLLFWGSLTVAKLLSSGDTLSIPTGSARVYVA